MTARHLLALAATFLICTSSAQADKLNWSSRKIQLSIQRNLTDTPVPTGISVRKGTDEIAVVGDDHLVRIKQRTTGKLIRLMETHSDWVKIALYHPNGQTLFTAGDDNTIIAWNAENDHDYRRFAREDRPIEGMAIDAQGEYLATVGFNNKLNLYKVDESRLVQTINCPCQDMRAIQFSPNGEILAVAGRNGIIRVLQVKDGKELFDIQAHSKRIRDLQFIDDQTIVTCSDDMTVKMTNLSDRKPTLILKKNAKFYSLAYLGSNQMAVGSSDNLIRIINIKSKSELGLLKGHTGTVCELISDGNELISGSFDTEIRVWQTENTFVSAPKVPAPNVLTTKKPALTQARPQLPPNAQIPQKAQASPTTQSQPNNTRSKTAIEFKAPETNAAKTKVVSSKTEAKQSKPTPPSASGFQPTASPNKSFTPNSSFVVPGNKPAGEKSSDSKQNDFSSGFSTSGFQIAK